MHPDPRVLSTLLCGRPLSQRDATDATPDAALADALDEALAHAIGVLSEEVAGVGDPLAQARHEWERVSALPPDFGGIAARRACLLFALHREPATPARASRPLALPPVHAEARQREPAASRRTCRTALRLKLAISCSTSRM